MASPGSATSEGRDCLLPQALLQKVRLPWSKIGQPLRSTASLCGGRGPPNPCQASIDVDRRPLSVVRRARIQPTTVTHVRQVDEAEQPVSIFPADSGDLNGYHYVGICQLCRRPLLRLNGSHYECPLHLGGLRTTSAHRFATTWIATEALQIVVSSADRFRACVGRLSPSGCPCSPQKLSIWRLYTCKRNTVAMMCYSIPVTFGSTCLAESNALSGVRVRRIFRPDITASLSITPYSSSKSGWSAPTQTFSVTLNASWPASGTVFHTSDIHLLYDACGKVESYTGLG